MPDAVSMQLTWPGAVGALGWWHLSAIVIAAGLIVWLSWSERQLVGPGVGWSLLALRFATLGSILLLLWQPTWAWVIRREQVGRVVIAVDLSESMQSGDPQADDDERRRWLTALGWLSGTEQSPDPSVSKAATTAQQLGIDAGTWQELTEALSALSRAETASRVLAGGPATALQRLDGEGGLQVLGYGGESVASSWKDLPQLVQEIPATARPDETRLLTVLQTLSRAAATERIQGVLVFTDGRDSDAAAAVEQARSLGQRNIPIYPVAIGSRQLPKDLMIVGIDAPAVVYRGDQAKVRALVTTPGFSDEPFEITLVRIDGPEEQVIETRSLQGSSRIQTIEWEIATDAVEELNFRVAITPRPGEATEQNNQREFSLQVVDDRTKVLLVDGSPRWEFRYLEIALSRDERVDLKRILFDQPYLGLLPEPYFPRTWPETLPAQPAGPFSGRDMVIVGDVPPLSFSDEHWSQLSRYVSDEGGTLVLVAGRHFPALLAQHETLRTLLPVTQPQLKLANISATAEPSSRGWRWTLTAEGLRQTALQLTGDSESNRSLWPLLPGATSAFEGRPKPGATVWAEGRLQDQPAVPLLVQQYFGKGQVIWLASDSTWRWRFRADDEFHHRFWAQLSLQAAQAKLATHSQMVQFGPLKPVIDVGEAVEILARWSNPTVFEEIRQKGTKIEVLRAGDKTIDVPLAVSHQRPFTSEALLSKLSPGEYTLRLIAPGIDLGAERVEAPLIVRAPPSLELADRSVNLAFLDDLAAASGGKVIPVDELTEFCDELTLEKTISSLPQARPVWDRWPGLILIMALMAAEWGLRRHAGLA